MRLETEQIVYRDGDARLNGLFAIDSDRVGKRPGVLVVHGGAGVDDHARGRALRFAEGGFAVFACDMYGEGVTGNREQIVRHIGELRTNRGAVAGSARNPVIATGSRQPYCGSRLLPWWNDRSRVRAQQLDDHRRRECPWKS
jgi:dienelactone hydrolase